MQDSCGAEGGILDFNSAYFKSELKSCGRKFFWGSNVGSLENTRKLKLGGTRVHAGPTTLP